MMKYILNILMLFTAMVAAAATSGGGGDLDKIRRGDDLTKTQLEKLMEGGGKLLKEEFLLQMVKNVDPKSINNLVVKEMYEKMQTGETSLEEDVLWAPYILGSGNCSVEQEACTDDMKPMDTIYFEESKLLTAGTNIHELVALAMHEHSHHYLGDKDHHNKFALYYFFAELSVKGTFKDDKLFHRPQLDPYSNEIRTVINASSSYNNQKTADKFCSEKGYLNAKDYRTDYFTFKNGREIQIATLSDLGAWEYKLSGKCTKEKCSKKLYSEILCSDDVVTSLFFKNDDIQIQGTHHVNKGKWSYIYNWNLQTASNAFCKTKNYDRANMDSIKSQYREVKTVARYNGNGSWESYVNSRRSVRVNILTEIECLK